MQSKYKKTMKNSVFSYNKLRQIFMAKDESVEWEEKVGLQVVPALNLYFQCFFVRSSPETNQKMPKLTKTGYFWEILGSHTVKLVRKLTELV